MAQVFCQMPFSMKAVLRCGFLQLLPGAAPYFAETMISVSVTLKVSGLS